MAYQHQQQQQPPVMQQPGGTTVVVNQQQIINVMRDWRSGLLGCFDDCGICLCVQFCGPCAACQLAGDMGETCCIVGCVPNFMIPLRTKLRTQLNIHGSICNDCLVTTFCGTCALCQMMREHKMARQNGEL